MSQDDAHSLSWTNPVVLSLTLMTVWLLVAEVFRLIYPAARQGRKVAYLTWPRLCFCCLVFASVMWGDSFHNQRAERAESVRDSDRDLHRMKGGSP